MLPQLRNKRLILISALGLAGVCVASVAGKQKKNSEARQADESKRALHALNRLTFGPRPGEVQRVAAMGVDEWINQQLHPEKIDDSGMEARLAPFRTLRMDTRELVENFPPPQLIKAVLDGKRKMPSDPSQRAVYEAQIERLQEKQERKEEAVAPTTDANKMNPADTTANLSGESDSAANSQNRRNEEEQARRREDRLYADLKAQQLLDLPPDQRMKEVLEMSPEDQRALAASLKGAKADEFAEGMSPKQKETLQALNNPQQVVAEELMQAKLLRAIYSERQLDEVMTDFWFNHFNVFIGKGPERYLITNYERDVIRPHALGRFEDLLVATAKSPAMLFYLDNWLSVGPHSQLALGLPRNPYRVYRRFPPPNPRPQAKRSGLNENYGRELMELHTLGVNGGYTQRDVTELARIFTGWTIDQPQKGGGFKYEERMHEPGDKMFLDHRIKDRGQKEGMEALHILAHHRSTAHFICTKLAMRFLSDNPPSALVERMAQTFLKKDGDIREVLKTMFQSPEFWSDDTYRAKVKTPLEFVVSAVRTTGANVTDAMPLARQLNNMGMPLYGMQPPTGYSMKAETWVNSSALLGRMNFSVALMGDKLKGVQVDPNQLLNPARPTDAEQVLAQLESSLLAGDVSPTTHEAIRKRFEDPQIAQRKLDDPARPPDVAILAGLILGSPEFQRR
jgi:uncharacterized protein (DUF1800 family)